MMNFNMGSKFYNNNIEENDGDTDNYITCPLLQIKYSRPRKPITSRLGQKARSLKYNNDNRALFENKTADADLGSSFQVHTPKKLVHSLEKLDLVQNTPFVRPAIKAQSHSNIETPSDTFTNLNRNTVRKLNFKPALPLSTKRSLYYNKENLPEQSKEELNNLESIILPQSDISTTSCSIDVEENVKEIASKLPVINDDTCYTSPETSKSNYDTSLYHSLRETTSIPKSSFLSFCKNSSNSLVDSSLSTEQLECQPLDAHPKHHNTSIPELTPIAKCNNFVVRAQTSTYINSTVSVQDEELKQPINLSGSVCIKCATDNFISVKGIKYSILNTLGHGGSSIVYEVLHPETNQVMAIKKVDLSEVENIIAKGYLNEVSLLQNLQDCESVIRLFDSQYTVKEKILYMVMEKGDTDLSKLIRSTKNMSVHMIMYYWTEMLTTVSEIHAKGVIHSDLKPANFLLVSGRLKLIDFGIASKIQGDMTSVLKDVTTGTWNYMSPECIRSGGSNFEGHKINQKSDVWSLGCILYSLVYGKTPYSHLTNTWQKLQSIAESKQNINFPSHSKVFTEGVPSVLQQTMQLCLIKDVKARPYVIDLLKLIEDTVFKPMTAQN
ncbi:dual specificity protein kinase TTK-like [Acyrthosiphon pisum]|uniref:Protein kinase domain-containing protein n=1 Tax=Acyrthosiphon pisum TaxID=7029 RepID=A0A8R2A9V8_ACYPI|nr:dual specificity protein kinase TTK-like [Acyrthosiphon pisum]XP_016655900.1 dual specificity protein kinase TTK-like [Acyrthosiphon pisum]|eukprot:XP_003241140.2 PREDICTED: dual specificity protein kinase TTK-like [Acyrthosiphon pisum]